MGLGITANEDRITQRDYKRSKELEKSKPYKDVNWLYEKDKMLFEANFEELSTGDQSKYIVFVSINAVSQLCL
jgi:hypothetical protein